MVYALESTAAPSTRVARRRSRGHWQQPAARQVSAFVRLLAAALLGLCLGQLPSVSVVWAQDHEWTLLEDDDTALAARLELIQQAREEICIACYNVDSGYVVGRLAQALSERTAQGLRARLLIDGLPARKLHEHLESLVRCGIEVKLFHPLEPARLRQLNRRLHSKLMVADDQAIILGSRNLTDPHFGLADPAFIDVDFLLHGELAGQGRHYFNWLWDSCGAVSLTELLAVDPLAAEAVTVADLSVATQEPTTIAAIDRRTGTAAAGDLALLQDTDTWKRRGQFEPRLLAAIDRAQCAVVLETPYPAFSHRLGRGLAEAARRGVCVTVLTNAANNTDRATTYAAWQNQKPRLQRAGVEVREYAGPGRIHAKTLVVDQLEAWVGSYNFDPRGDRLNLELALLVSDPNFVQAINDSLWRRHAGSPALPDRPTWRLTPGTSGSQRLRIRTLQGLMPLLRPIL